MTLDIQQNFHTRFPIESIGPTMVQRLRLHAAPQERALPVLQPKRTKSFDIIERIIENGRLQKELPAPEREQEPNESRIETQVTGEYACVRL